MHPRPGSSGLYQVSGRKPGKNGRSRKRRTNSKVTLTLSTPRTRTTLVSETYVHWSEEDIVQINGTNLPVIPDPNDPTRATISNVDTAEEYVALYSPDNGGYIPEREVVEAYFRPEVPHTPDSFYTTGGNPMVAYSTSTSLEFKNIGGLLRIGVTGDASIASVMLSGNAGEPIARHFEISKSDLASGSLDFAPGEGSAQFVSTSVTMTCTENVRLDANSPTYFYFALPAAEYTEGFTVTLTDSEGNTCLRQTHNSVSIERATLKSMEPIAFEKDKALTVTLGEIAANSVTWNIEVIPRPTCGPCSSPKRCGIISSHRNITSTIRKNSRPKSSRPIPPPFRPTTTAVTKRLQPRQEP